MVEPTLRQPLYSADREQADDDTSQRDSDAAWVATFLSEALLGFAESEDRDVTVTPFREGGVLNDDEGFTVRFGKPGGSEFQVTVVRSR